MRHNGKHFFLHLNDILYDNMAFTMMQFIKVYTLLLTINKVCIAFSPIFQVSNGLSYSRTRESTTTTERWMAADPITALRTEWVSAALCSNQIPRAADVCLQLGVEDGKLVSFVPRTIRQIITSSLEADGVVTVAAQRRLKQSQERRKAATVKYVDQRADDLKEVSDESVDIVVSLQAAQKMHNNGLDWKKSIREAARVLKPGGRFLFVEDTTVNNESYLDYVEGLYTLSGELPEDPDAVVPIFEVGYDEIDLVLSPHIAGVAFKSEEAGLAPEEISKRRQDEEKERLADLSIAAYERGIKKRKRKKTVEEKK